MKLVPSLSATRFPPAGFDFFLALVSPALGMYMTVTCPCQRAIKTALLTFHVPDVRSVAMHPTAPLRVALLGHGTVGSAFSALVHGGHLPGVQLRAIVVRDPASHIARFPQLPPSLFVSDALATVVDREVDVVVELIGGIEPARSLVTAALAAGKHVVSANKALLAAEPGLFRLASDADVDLRFEAAVCAALPVVHALRDHLAACEVYEMQGVVNGTTNFILSTMRDGGSYSEALAEAQRLGFAEQDPTADVSGADAAAKIALLASLAFRSWVPQTALLVRGIEGVSNIEMLAARRLGRVVKLLALADPGRVEVLPVLLDPSHPFATLRGGRNGVALRSSAGWFEWFAHGAGGFETAVAVAADVLALRTRLPSASLGDLRRLVDAPAAPASSVSKDPAEGAVHVYALCASLTSSAPFADFENLAVAHGLSLRSSVLLTPEDTSGTYHPDTRQLDKASDVLLLLSGSLAAAERFAAALAAECWCRRVGPPLRLLEATIPG